MASILEQLKTINDPQEILGFDEREFKALIGVSPTAFIKLLEPFYSSLAVIKARLESQRNRPRQRKAGGGRKAKLRTVTSKLGFILHYLKRYDTLDALGDRVDLHRSNVSRNVQSLLAVLVETLQQLNVLPKRSFTAPAELAAAFAGIEELVVDATERPILRPQDASDQKKLQRQKTSKFGQKHCDRHVTSPDSVLGLHGLGQSARLRAFQN